MTTTAPTADLAEEVLAGLVAPPYRLPCKLLYDAEGSRLFERICNLPDYYPTRTEIGILDGIAAELADAIGPAAEVVEFGSGSGCKTRLLMDALHRPRALHLIEISPSALEDSVRRLDAALPTVKVCGWQGDYTRTTALPPSDGRRVVFFPGSTIGNFTPVEAADFLRRARTLAGPEGLLILGTDLVKPAPILEAAYNDRDGITAQFNRNILVHGNRLFAGDCDPDAFRHQAPWDPVHRRIDMYLVARRDTAFRWNGQSVRLRRGERIHTEHSHKFTIADVDTLAGGTGWRRERTWTDARDWFGVHLLAAA